MSACSDVPFFFFFKQKTAYDIVSRDWSSDVCSSDLGPLVGDVQIPSAVKGHGRRPHQRAIVEIELMRSLRRHATREGVDVLFVVDHQHGDACAFGAILGATAYDVQQVAHST